MNESLFKTEMMKAQTMREAGDQPDYWMRYERGLRRTYHGENFGTDEEHQLWSESVNSDDPQRHARGRGYLDGLAVSQI